MPDASSYAWRPWQKLTFHKTRHRNGSFTYPSIPNRQRPFDELTIYVPPVFFEEVRTAARLRSLLSLHKAFLRKFYVATGSRGPALQDSGTLLAAFTADWVNDCLLQR
jgi:hypothetical protein